MPNNKRSYTMISPDGSQNTTIYSAKRLRGIPSAVMVKNKNSQVSLSGFGRSNRKKERFLSKGSGVEKKFLTVANKANVNYTAPYIVNMVEGINLGTGFKDRVGKKILVKSIQVRLKIYRPINNSANVNDARAWPYCTVRMLIFVDTQANGYVHASSTDILDNSTFFVGGSTAEITAPLDPRVGTRYKVLKDVTFELDDGHGAEQCYQYYMKTKIEVEFGDTAGSTFPNILKNQLIMMLVTDKHDTVNCPLVQTTHRLRYTDP